MHFNISSTKSSLYVKNSSSLLDVYNGSHNEALNFFFFFFILLMNVICNTDALELTNDWYLYECSKFEILS